MADHHRRVVGIVVPPSSATAEAPAAAGKEGFCQHPFGTTGEGTDGMLLAAAQFEVSSGGHEWRRFVRIFQCLRMVLLFVQIVGIPALRAHFAM